MYTVEGHTEEWWVKFNKDKLFPALDMKPFADAIASKLNGLGKSERQEQFRDAVSHGVFGRTVTHSIAKNRCVMCYQRANTFHSRMNMEAYAENGLCQNCQDKIK
jgi:hypothetical protein